MNTISFDNFYNYFQEYILNKSAELYNSGIIKEDLQYVFYKETGEYLNALNAIQYEDDAQIDRRVLVNIMNGGGVQDSSISIDTYVQIVSFEVLALDDQRYDVEQVFMDFTAEFKSKLGTLANSTVQFSMDDFPKLSEKFDAHGYEKFTVSCLLNAIVIPGAKVGNSFELKINNTVVKFNKVAMARASELTPSLQKQTEVKFFPNTTTFVLNVSGLFVDNSVIASMIQDCSFNTNFNQTYVITLTENGTQYVNDSFYVKDINFEIAYGSIITWNVTFYKSRGVN